MNDLPKTTKRGLQFGSGQYGDSVLQPNSVRQPEKFYSDMIQFKEARDKKVMEMRLDEENHIKRLCNFQAKVFVSEG